MYGVYFDLNSLHQFPPLLKPKHETIKDITKPDRCYIDDLNDTLLELILLKLFSCKHLSTFKCVSKRWNQVISNPDFVRQFTYQYFPFTLCLETWKEARLITEHPYFKTYKFCLDFLPSNTYDQIVAQHNDLFVIHSEEKGYYIANPLTKQFVVVPDPEIHVPLMESNFSTKWWPREVGLAGVVDGVSSQCVTNSFHNNLGFRIVRISTNYYPDEGQEAIVQIYSSQTAQWITQPLENFHIDGPIKGSVTLKNKVYFLGLLCILVIDPFSDDIIAPRVINLPEGIPENSILGLCRTRLRIIADLEPVYINENYPRIKVWEFDDDFTSNLMAKLKLVINFSLERYCIDSVDYTSNFFVLNRMVCCHPNEPHIVYFIYDQKVFCCDVVKPRLKAMSVKLGLYGSWGNRIVTTYPLTM